MTGWTMSFALLRFNPKISTDPIHSNVPIKKGRAPLEALPFTAISADFIFVAYFFEALPLIMPLNLAGGS